jgi:23S rRNA pseudouridine1911/1915/1917 synthase
MDSYAATEQRRAKTKMAQELLKVIFEDHHLLVINKPAGLVCHPTKGDAWSSLISRVRLYLSRGGQPIQPHLLNRLDRETSGLVLVAKTPETARSLGRLWESGQVEKQYLAIVHGAVGHGHGRIDAPLGRDPDSAVAIKDRVEPGPGGAPSVTEYNVLAVFERGPRVYSLLRVIPRTGRKHQIRIHLAHIGHPLVGDKIYGGDERLYLAFVEGRLEDAQWAQLILPHHALHAGRISLQCNGVKHVFESGPEEWFIEFIGRSRLEEALVGVLLRKAGEPPAN